MSLAVSVSIQAQQETVYKQVLVRLAGKGKKQACKNHCQHGDLLSPPAPVPINQKAAHFPYTICLFLRLK